MNEEKHNRGQGLVELALILPILVILLMGVIEIGAALRSYMVVVNADREACRFGSRGMYTPQKIMERAVYAGGVVRHQGQDVPFLRTHGEDPNAGVIVTYIPMSVTGEVPGASHWVSGFISIDGEVVPVGAEHTSLALAEIIQRQGEATEQINDLRLDHGEGETNNNMVAVEVVYAHYPLFGDTLHNITFGIVPPQPWNIHTDTLMRVVSDRGGGGGVLGEP